MEATKMPVVFVHGVATRQTPTYDADVKQRDQLFRRLVMGPDDDSIGDPDWGSTAVKLDRDGWIPQKGAAETFAGGTTVLPTEGRSLAAAVATRNVGLGVDLAFGALLKRESERQATAPTGLSDAELDAFAKAVAYLERQANPNGQGSDFTEDVTDAKFAQTLGLALSTGEHQAPAPPAVGAVETYGLVDDVFAAIGKALKDVTDPLRNTASDALLSLFRAPLSEKVALFLGDIFVYLRGREDGTSRGDYNRIFHPVIDALVEGANNRQGDQPLIVLGHSLGGVILYDLLSDDRCLTAIRAKTAGEFRVDHLVTVGSQPGLFANMNLFPQELPHGGRLPCPACVVDWMNVYDYTDVFSFTAAPFFNDVTDFEFDNVSGLLDAHTAYFQRPSFYQRLRARLKERRG
jgi:pimeloyl-ACP methyl ester carboxylesterase